jgi:hypothetical protein
MPSFLVSLRKIKRKIHLLSPRAHLDCIFVDIEPFICGLGLHRGYLLCFWIGWNSFYSEHYSRNGKNFGLYCCCGSGWS